MLRTILANALFLTASLLAAVPAQADPAGPSAAWQDCRDVEVQHQLSNEYDCQGCGAKVVVQVGLSNRIECDGGDCSGNVFVQAGLENSADCGNGALPLPQVAEADGPCPPQLPDGNFWCHLVARLVPEEMCLSLEFCLW